MIANSSVLWGGVLLLVLAILWLQYDSGRLKREMRRSRKGREQREAELKLLQQEWDEFVVAEKNELDQQRIAMHRKYASEVHRKLGRLAGLLAQD
ncbi:hypothetical protein [Scandinavium goeteborgense]|uniref:Uncharacterized protein n=1 Tax=Scandinavium goeteborgense TaxID=1851514 RepID=A0A4R6EEC2_SCAGO|nr:hypothetical protein [Scandinavium goeteborgense]TDN56586.1 hypothetical protein EC847_11091 [Scandinavium goeteborgense]